MPKNLRLTAAQHAARQERFRDLDQPNKKQEKRPFRLTQPVEPEASVLDAVLRVLQMHRRVAWVQRMNTGAGRFVYPDGSTSQFMRFGFPGMSDIIGQLVTGQFFACETKRPHNDPTKRKRRELQQAFIDMVNRNGGVAFFARSIDDVLRELGPA